MTTRERLEMWLEADRQLAEQHKLQAKHQQEREDLAARQAVERQELFERR